MRTEYAYIRSYISELHAKHATDIDLFVHVGMANGWDFVSVERRAFRQGFSSDWWGGSPETGGSEYYMIPDDKGQTVLDAGDCPWEKVPLGLGTGVDVDEVVGGANERLDVIALGEGRGKKRVVVEPHHEAGTYCCGYTYYESLANKWVKGTKGQVLFCHVPGEMDQESLEAGRDAIVSVIAAAVELLVKKETKAVESKPI